MSAVNVRVTNHAVERYMERVRPGLDFKRAKAELIHLVGQFGEERPRPEWMSMKAQEPDVWVAVGDDVWLPCERRGDGRLVAHTVLAQGCLSAEARARRNADRRRRPTQNKLTRGERAAIQRTRERAERDGAWAA